MAIMSFKCYMCIICVLYICMYVCVCVSLSLNTLNYSDVENVKWCPGLDPQDAKGQGAAAARLARDSGRSPWTRCGTHVVGHALWDMFRHLSTSFDMSMSETGAWRIETCRDMSRHVETSDCVMLTMCRCVVASCTVSWCLVTSVTSSWCTSWCTWGIKQVQRVTTCVRGSWSGKSDREKTWKNCFNQPTYLSLWLDLIGCGCRQWETCPSPGKQCRSRGKCQYIDVNEGEWTGVLLSWRCHGKPIWLQMFGMIWNDLGMLSPCWTYVDLMLSLLSSEVHGKVLNRESTWIDMPKCSAQDSFWAKKNPSRTSQCGLLFRATWDNLS